MDYLFKIKDAAVQYLSPAAKRRRTLPPSTPAGELQQAPVFTEPRDHKHQAIVTERLSRKYLSPSDTKASKKRKRKDDDYIPDDAPLTPEDSASYIKSRSVLSAEDRVAEEEFENDEEKIEEISAEAKVHAFLERQTELERRQETLDGLRLGDWHPDEIKLFEKLSMRGYEPLLARTWAWDFRGCPASIFTTKDDETFINSKSGNEFRATMALQSLVTLGARVRAQITSRKPQEPLIKKELENYIKWSEKDGGYNKKRFLPLIVIIKAHVRQSLDMISKRMTDQLVFLAKRHRQALALPASSIATGMEDVKMFVRPPPVVYGVIISQYIVVFTSLDSSKQGAKVKTIAHFDFSQVDMDVWNGFALAILVIMVRNKLMEWKDQMPDESEGEEVDPDL